MTDVRPNKRKVDFHEKEGFTKMILMGTTANLLNCSPGRDPEHTAKFAYKVAAAAWKVWVEEGRKEGIVDYNNG